MREIKFRAWDGEKMHYLNLYQCVYYDNDFVLRENDCEFWIDDHVGTVKWDIMQFTGFHDISNTRIYEDDIVKFGTKIGRVVFSDDGCWCIYTKDDILFNLNMCVFDTDTIIIGNIYKNKELLNGTSAR